MLLRVGLLTAWMLLNVVPVHADEAITPESVVRTYYERLQTGDFGAYAEFVHPEEAARFKSMLMDVYRAANQDGDRKLIDATFGPEATLDDVEKTTPEEFIRAFMGLVSAMMGKIQFSRFDLIGSVPEGDMTHVVLRTQIAAEGVEVTQMEVVSTRPFEGQPRLMLTGAWEGIGAAMGRARPAPQPEPAGPGK